MFFIIHSDDGFGITSTLVVEAAESFEPWFLDVFTPWARRNCAPHSFEMVCKAEHVEMIDEFAKTTAEKFWSERRSSSVAIDRGADVIPGPSAK